MITLVECMMILNMCVKNCAPDHFVRSVHVFRTQFLAVIQFVTVQYCCPEEVVSVRYCCPEEVVSNLCFPSQGIGCYQVAHLTKMAGTSESTAYVRKDSFNFNKLQQSLPENTINAPLTMNDRKLSAHGRNLLLGLQAEAVANANKSAHKPIRTGPISGSDNIEQKSGGLKAFSSVVSIGSFGSMSDLMRQNSLKNLSLFDQTVSSAPSGSPPNPPTQYTYTYTYTYQTRIASSIVLPAGSRLVCQNEQQFGCVSQKFARAMFWLAGFNRRPHHGKPSPCVSNMGVVETHMGATYTNTHSRRIAHTHTQHTYLLLTFTPDSTLFYLHSTLFHTLGAWSGSFVCACYTLPPLDTLSSSPSPSPDPRPQEARTRK